jgi:hypothetical protein
MPVDETAITQYITDTFDGLDVVVASQENGAPEVAWGDSFFFYDPGGTTPPDRRMPFATIVTQDYGDFDRASQLHRPGVFRLNIDVGRETYRSLFGPQPSRPGDSGVVDTGHDFTALNQLMPHPVYAPQSWVCILNPSEAKFQEVVQPLLADAYNRAASRYASRADRG